MTVCRPVALLCAATMVLALAGCSASGDTATPGADPASDAPAFADVEPDELVIGIAPGGDALPLVVADRQGSFDEAGVTVTIKPFATAKERDAALAAGEIDAMVADLVSAATLEVADTPVAIVSVLADLAVPAGEASTSDGQDAGQGQGAATGRSYLMISDYYIALPSGLLAARAALEAVDAAVVRIQADPAAHQPVLTEIAGTGVTVDGGAYPASVAPGIAEIESALESLDLSGVAAGDLVLDIGR